MPPPNSQQCPISQPLSRPPSAVGTELRGQGQLPGTVQRRSRSRLTAVGPEQIRTVQSQVRKTSEIVEPTTDAEYQATECLYVECVPETVDQIVDEVTDAGGSIKSVEFELHDSTRQELHEDALSAAMEQARAKATQIAAAEGLEVAGVQRVTTVDVPVAGTHGGDLLGSVLEDQKNAVPKPIPVAGSVEVVYAVRNA